MSEAARVARTEEVPELAAVLTRAFEADPPSRWILDDDATYADRATRFYELLLGEEVPRGHVLTTDDHAGVAIWQAPGQWGFHEERLPALIAQMSEIYGERFSVALGTFATMVERHPGDPHWYLWVIGVDPGRHGEGVGSRLMAPVLERADAERVPAYLEASTPRSAAGVYARAGFEVTEVWNLPDGGPPVTGMWRPPR
jgi:GNAT superfamily N-acetyltransferase